MPMEILVIQPTEGARRVSRVTVAAVATSGGEDTEREENAAQMGAREDSPLTRERRDVTGVQT